MGEIRNARCLFLQWRWRQYADQQVDPIWRSWPGSITPIMHWILYADPQVDPMWRSLTRGGRRSMRHEYDAMKRADQESYWEAFVQFAKPAIGHKAQ